VSSATVIGVFSASVLPSSLVVISSVYEKLTLLQEMINDLPVTVFFALLFGRPSTILSCSVGGSCFALAMVVMIRIRTYEDPIYALPTSPK
jgi:hypothetical protein